MRGFAFVSVTALLLAACSSGRYARGTGENGAGKAPPQLHSVATVTERDLPCTQATTIARQALIKLGYTIESVEAAKPDAPGRVAGIRNTGWTPRIAESGTVYTTVIEVKCSDAGATFEALSDEGFTRRIGLRRDFPPAVAGLLARKVKRPRAKREPDRGLLITVEPQRGRDAGAEFGADLPASGVTPVRLKIENRTERTYGFEREQVKLMTQEGRRVEPLRDKEIENRLGTPLQSQLAAKLITDGDLQPGATRSGFVYFPAAAYRRATIIMLDRESDEPEGFSVEF
jgi:hypothetical protein